MEVGLPFAAAVADVTEVGTGVAVRRTAGDEAGSATGVVPTTTGGWASALVAEPVGNGSGYPATTLPCDGTVGTRGSPM